MEEYLNFIPSKFPLQKDRTKDLLYLFRGDDLVIRETDGRFHIPTREHLEGVPITFSEEYCMGNFRGIDCMVANLSDFSEQEGLRLVSLRNYGNKAEYQEFLVASKARLLIDYANANKKCGICGSDMMYKREGNDRAFECAHCGNVVWPRTAPAIIVAVTKGDRLLLAHNKNFASGKFSVVAGFVEYGETFEDCVRREVLEETGIQVKNIRYFGSQPWAFPNSYMIGFTAEYSEGELRADEDEISEVGWFSKDEIPGIYTKSVSISSQLIEWFLDR